MKGYAFSNVEKECFIQQWTEITTKLKNSGYNFSKVQIVRKEDESEEQ